MTSVYWTLWIVGMGVGLTLTLISVVIGFHANRAGQAGEHAYKRYFEAMDRAATHDDMEAAQGHVAIAHSMYDTCHADFALARRFSKLGNWMIWIVCAVTWGRIGLAWLV